MISGRQANDVHNTSDSRLDEADQHLADQSGNSESGESFYTKVLKAFGGGANTSNSADIPSTLIPGGTVSSDHQKSNKLQDVHLDVVRTLAPDNLAMGGVINPGDRLSFQEFMSTLVRSDSDKTQLWREGYQEFLDPVDEHEEMEAANQDDASSNIVDSYDSRAVHELEQPTLVDGFEVALIDNNEGVTGIHAAAKFTAICCLLIEQ